VASTLKYVGIFSSVAVLFIGFQMATAGAPMKSLAST
jgi:hypothetical protein